MLHSLRSLLAPPRTWPATTFQTARVRTPEYSPSAPSEPVAKQPRDPRTRRGPWSTLFCAQCLVVGACLGLVSPRFAIARPLPWRVPAARLGGLALRPLTPVLLSAEMPIRTPATWPLVWPYQQHGATSSTEVACSGLNGSRWQAAASAMSGPLVWSELLSDPLELSPDF